MKYTTAVTLMASLMGSATAKPSAEVLEHYKGGNAPIRERTPIIDIVTGARKQCKTLENSNICQLVEVPGTRCVGPDCRRLQGEILRQRESVVPYPANGGSEKTDQAITFKESPDAVEKINCFKFCEGDNAACTDVTDPKSIKSTCDGITFDDEGNAMVELNGLTEGEWTWWAENENGDQTSKQTFSLEKAVTTETTEKTIVRQSSKAGGNEMVGEEAWEYGGQIAEASGRIYYTSCWGDACADYACSGTVIKDNKSGRTLIMTAAHCVWDDIDETWGSNVVFIPNRDAIQTDLTGDDVYRQCQDDVCGCWTISAGFTHDLWKTEGWPYRLAYDWGLWVVDDVGSHEGTSNCGSDALDEAVNEVEFQVGVDLTDQFVTSLGYTAFYNPDLRYCAQNVGFEQPVAGVDTYWLPGCGLSGGASGGPWILDMDTSDGTGKIVSVNSWSYSEGDNFGMGGPIIDAPGARCLVNAARGADFAEIEAREVGEQGEFINCYDRECIPASQVAAATGRRLRGLKGKKICGQNKRIGDN